MPGIAYRIDGIDRGAASISEVRYRLAKNAEPGADGDWNPAFTLQQRELPPPPEGDLPPENYPEGTGLFTAQARAGDGLPIVAWYDRTMGALWWSRFVGAGFAEPEMLAGWGHPDRSGDMGSNVDLMVDGQGNAHLCYQDGSTDSLRYLAPDLDRDEWVDDGVREQQDGREYAVHVVGEDCNVRIDGNGQPFIVYQDATAHEVLIARRGPGPEGAFVWSWTRIRGHENMFQGSFGFYTRARRVGDQALISSNYYDHQSDPTSEGLDVFARDL